MDELNEMDESETERRNLGWRFPKLGERREMLFERERERERERVSYFEDKLGVSDENFGRENLGHVKQNGGQFWKFKPKGDKYNQK